MTLPDRNITGLVPLRTSFDAISIMTDPQRRKMRELIESYKANSASMTLDSGNNGNVLFCLYKDGFHEAAIVYGLIEPDGRSHT